MKSVQVTMNVSDHTDTPDLEMVSQNEVSPLTSSKVHITWENLTVSYTAPASRRPCCKSGEKSELIPDTILNDVSGVVKPGQFLAILGASGAGKTTLLNTLACRVTSKLDVSGSVKINGVQLTREGVKKICGYVEQNDTFVGTMTVREVVMFYGNLRLDSRIPSPTKQKMADSIIKKVGLTKIENNVVGSDEMPGISGGEKKRLSIATQLIIGASLLFLDEVTSGLDSFMAENILNLIKDLAKAGCTVLCTIHQPASELYVLFDRVCLVAEGNIAFMGTPSDALTYFKKAGFPCPTHYCPADHFIYTLAIRPGYEEKCRDQCDQLTKLYRSSEYYEEILNEIQNINTASGKAGERNPKDIPITPVPCWKQVLENFIRTFRDTVRNPRSSKSRVISGVVLSILIGIFYFDTKNDIKTVQANKCGLILILTLCIVFRNLVFSAQTIPLEYPTVRKEYRTGLYTTLPYFLSVVICEIPFLILIPFLMFSISYFAVGLRRDPISFLNAVASSVMLGWASSSLGWLVGAIAVTPKFAGQLAGTVVMPFFFFSGLFKSEQETPVYLLPIKYASWLRYGFNMMMVNEFKDLELECEGSGPCPYNGTSILLEMGINPEELWWPNVTAMFVIGAGFSFLTWLCLARGVTKH